MADRRREQPVADVPAPETQRRRTERGRLAEAILVRAR
jgi:hypothetical protein